MTNSGENIALNNTRIENVNKKKNGDNDNKHILAKDNKNMDILNLSKTTITTIAMSRAKQ